MLLPFILSTAFAGDPVRCAATVTTPTEGCNLRDSFTVTSGGRTEAAATRAAQKALKDALMKSSAAFYAAQPAANAKETVACEALVEGAHVDCFPEAGLAEDKYCFVTLSAPDCWDDTVLEVEARGWKAFDAGRKAMCDAVDARAVKLNYPDVEARRIKCAAACATHTLVRCP